MEEDIQNYSPIVMFRGTPCILSIVKNSDDKGNESLPQTLIF